MYEKYSEVIDKNLFFISDEPSEIEKKNIYHYDNNLMNLKGFYNMHDKIKNTSWDKVFYHLNNNLNYDYYWIIEDDVYLNKQKFNNFINSYSNTHKDLLLFGWYKSFKDNDKWIHWTKNKNIFKENELKSAITQVIRISNKMKQKILDFKEKNGKFIFHEILIASLAFRNELSHKLIKRDDIHNTSSYNLSLLHLQFKNNKKKMLNSIKNNMVLVHPFKNWYDL